MSISPEDVIWRKNVCTCATGVSKIPCFYDGMESCEEMKQVVLPKKKGDPVATADRSFGAIASLAGATLVLVSPFAAKMDKMFGSVCTCPDGSYFDVASPYVTDCTAYSLNHLCIGGSYVLELDHDTIRKMWM